MNVSVESAEGLTRKLRVEVPAEQIDEEILKRLRSAGKNAKLPGFRPGKVPAKVVEQRYGAQIRQDVMTEFMQSSYSEALQKEDLYPAGNPDIVPDSMDGSDGLKYTATFEVFPEISLSGLDTIEVSRPVLEVGEADIDDMIENLQRQKGEWKAVERKSKKGDQVIVDFDGTLKGEAIPNGKGENVTVELGAGRMLEDFEKALTGVTGGDSIEFKVKYPKDYPQDDLAGKKADFKAEVHEVKAMELPPIDDELAAAYGVTEGGLAKLREDVSQNMQNEAQQKIRNDVKDQALNGLLAANDIEVPQALVDREIHNMQHEAMKQMGTEDHSQAPPAENFKEPALRRVKLGLLLQEFISSEKIELDEDRIKGRITEMFAGYDDPEAIVSAYMGNPQLRQQIEPMVLEDQAIEALIEKGSEKSKTVTFKEYMNG